MLLTPIERPRGLLNRLLYWMSRRRFGRVLGIFQVVYARLPGFPVRHVALMRYAETGLSIPPRLRQLIEVRVSRTNGCGFCGDLHEALGRRAGIAAEVFRALDDDEGDELTDAERVAVAYAATVARAERDAALEQRMRERWDERAIMEVIFVASFTTYMNRMARALRYDAKAPRALTIDDEGKLTSHVGIDGVFRLCPESGDELLWLNWI